MHRLHNVLYVPLNSLPSLSLCRFKIKWKQICCWLIVKNIFEICVNPVVVVKMTTLQWSCEDWLILFKVGAWPSQIKQHQKSSDYFLTCNLQLDVNDNFDIRQPPTSSCITSSLTRKSEIIWKTLSCHDWLSSQNVSCFENKWTATSFQRLRDFITEIQVWPAMTLVKGSFCNFCDVLVLGWKKLLVIIMYVTFCFSSRTVSLKKTPRAIRVLRPLKLVSGVPS